MGRVETVTLVLAMCVREMTEHGASGESPSPDFFALSMYETTT